VRPCLSVLLLLLARPLGLVFHSRPETAQACIKAAASAARNPVVLSLQGLTSPARIVSIVYSVPYNGVYVATSGHSSLLYRQNSCSYRYQSIIKEHAHYNE
jgi:hypothetical protein